MVFNFHTITKHLYWLGALLLYLALTNTAFAAQLNGVAISGNNEQTHIALKLRGNTDYHVFTLNNPERLVVDLTGTRLATRLHQPSYNNPAINDVRSGYPAPGTLRIVFDLKKSYHPHVALLRETGAKHRDLVIDLYEPGYHPPKIVKKPAALPVKNTTTQITTALAEEQMLEQAVAQESDQHAQSAPNPNLTAGVMPTLSEVAPKPPISPASTVLPPPMLTKPNNTERPITIIIDPGHGGKDPGTIGHFGVREKDVVLAISLDLYRQLAKDPRFHAVMTRGGDYFLSLRQRLSVTRQNHGDIFIAIHADTFKDPYSTGASIYALSAHGASSEAARWLAQKENYSELGDVNLSDKSQQLRSVLLDLSQTATIASSVELGNDLLQQLKTVGRLHNKIVEQAPFMVLKSPDIPSVLVETGFLSNTSEEERLRNPVYQEEIAEAIYAGIVNYFINYPLTGTLLAAQVAGKAT